MAAYHLDCKDHLGVLHLHASSANAMNDRVLQALTQGLAAARAANLRGLILTGYERFFSAGLDLLTVYDFDREQMRRFIAHWENTMIELFAFPLPVVAAINGAAAAGGCLMALACDYRVMAKEARIGMTGIRLGIALPAAALEIFRDVVPAANSASVLFSGKLFDAEEALKLGLINETVRSADLLATALQKLHELSQYAESSVASLKIALRQNTLTRIQHNAEKMRNEFLEIWFSPAARKKLEEIRDELLNKKQL